MADLREAARTRARECRTAVALLTRIPVGRSPPSPPARAVWAYPVAGALVGAIAAATLLAAAASGVPPLPAAVLALLAEALATGGLHEDGLADTVDALSGGWTAERRLAILRDSRIGAHGALALVLAASLRIGAVASLPPRQAAPALLAAAILSRGAMLPLLALSRPARPDGLGASLAEAPAISVLSGLVLACAFGILFGDPRFLPAAALAAGLGLAVARRRFGGFTGDLLGATAVTAESAVLLVAAAIA